MRRPTRLEAIVGVAALAVAGAVVSGVVALNATAVPITGEAVNDEIVRAGPDGFADFAVSPAAPSGADVAQTAVTTPLRASNQPVVKEWATAGIDAANAWIEPRAQSVRAFAARQEPRLSFSGGARESGGHDAQISIDFRSRSEPRPQTRAERLGLVMAPLPDKERKGRWFMFAAAGSDAVGMNMLRDRSGEMRRASWSAEKIAQVGDVQAGLGWRKGPIQASVGFVQREISAFGHSVDERFLAFTFSVKPQSKRVGDSRRAMIERAEAYSMRTRRGN